ncbi:MAG: NAD synthetase [Acidithiobacillales bacterium SG8_45]|jgi:NAD+ synthase (glutamine-hydrolysing)|nr:MAG: NAD synthetase [Acidithiobacillales bacterium SG8_45]
MNKGLRIVMGQLNLLVGDIEGNAEQVIASARTAKEELDADVIVYPELTLTGYPPEDLLLRPGLYAAVARALARIERAAIDLHIVVGYPLVENGNRYNAAAIIRSGKLIATYRKQCLPNYAVFDEKRYFSAGAEPCLVDVNGLSIAITICEDVWEPGPIQQAVANGAQLILNLNASPYHLNKWRERESMLCDRASANQVPVVYVNQVGGQDELVFDGNSFVVSRDGALTHRAVSFEPQLIVVNVDEHGNPVPGEMAPESADDESVYGALVLGVRDYVRKNGFPGVVIGLSGGVDSALTLAIAVDALGADQVEAVMMPSRYTRDISLEDAKAQAEKLYVKYSVIPIKDMFGAFEQALSERFAGLAADTTEENLQARIRGMLLMAISNKSGKMVLTTGNKSEMAVGYATLYGDMAGGFAAIKDVPKTMVYRLARYRNQRSPVIPERVIERAPSAELAPDQQDTDSLPEYDVLDAILEDYVEQDASPEDIIAEGYDPETVHRVIRMVDRNEYKRRQAAPGVRVTPRAFGRDRRYPITSGYREDESD